MHQAVALLLLDLQPGENDRHVRVISPGRAVHCRDRALVEHEPIRILNHVYVTGSGRVIVSLDLRQDWVVCIDGNPLRDTARAIPVLSVSAATMACSILAGSSLAASIFA